MPALTRIGDIAVGVCCCHKKCRGWVGTYVTGANTVIVEGSPDSRLGDVVVGCHAQVAVTASPNVLSEGIHTTRIGDSTAGCTSGTNVTGAATVFANEHQ